MPSNPTKSRVRGLLAKRWPGIRSAGEGGNGWVFSADDLAIKVLRRLDRYGRFRREVAAAEKLHGLPGVVPVREANLPSSLGPVDEWSDWQHVPFFSMPFFSGGNLSSNLRPLTSEPARQNAVHLLKSVAVILKLIHEKGFAHRDLKPDNILLNRAGVPHISDYGLSIDLEAEDERLTRTREVIGAFWYRAPEYLRGRLGQSDHRPGDVFSLGRVIWAVLEGREPKDVTDLEFLSDLDRSSILNFRRGALLVGVIRACTGMDPKKRPSAGEVEQALGEWLVEPVPTLDPKLLRERLFSQRSVIDARNNRLRREHLQDEAKQASRHLQKLLQPFLDQLRPLDEGARLEVYHHGGPFLGVTFTRKPKHSPGLIFQPHDTAEFVPKMFLGASICLTADESFVEVEWWVAAEWPSGQKKKQMVQRQKFEDFDGPPVANFEAATREGLDWLIQVRDGIVMPQN